MEITNNINNTNNINFFIQLNGLLETYTHAHNDINTLIKNKIAYHDMNVSNDILDKETDIIINKYTSLNNISNSLFDKLFEISNDVKSYLNKNCEHEWIIDYIDINPEHTEQIVYCNKCNTNHTI